MVNPEDYHAALADPESIELRAKLVAICHVGFRDLSENFRSRISGAYEEAGDSGKVMAVWRAAQAASFLLSAIVELNDDGNTYAASAMVRQLVEVEYLFWACSDDLLEAEAWLYSDDEERRSRWAPRHLRARSNGRFRAVDYGDHCELGGHPTPKGISFFADVPVAFSQAVVIYETALHASSSWLYALTAIDQLAEEDELEPWNLVDATAVRLFAEVHPLWRSQDLMRAVLSGYFDD